MQQLVQAYHNNELEIIEDEAQSNAAGDKDEGTKTRSSSRMGTTTVKAETSKAKGTKAGGESSTKKADKVSIYRELGYQCNECVARGTTCVWKEGRGSKSCQWCHDHHVKCPGRVRVCFCPVWVTDQSIDIIQCDLPSSLTMV